jgi:spermidine synthase
MGAINILGGVLGSLFIGFIALPNFGMQISLQFITAIALATGFIAILTKNQQRRPATRSVRKLAWMTIPAIAWIVIPVALGTRLPDDYLDAKELLVDVEEGYGSTLSVSRKGTSLQLKIDRLWQGTDVKNHQFMVAHIPMLLHPSPKDMLVIGIGVGQTASRFLYYEADSLDVVDIEPAIFPFVRRNFQSQWMDDPRVTLLPEDGRTFIEHGKKRYDIISIEVGQVFRPGVESFYSVEFYRSIKQRLQEEGLIAQFVPLAFFKPEQFKRILATFRDIFPNCVLWYNTQEMLLIGNNNGQLNIDPNRLKLLTTDNPISQDMAFSYWGDTAHHLNNLEVFLAGFVSGPEQIAALAKSMPLYTDDKPALAYAVSDAKATDHNEIELTRLIAGHLSEVKNIYKGQLSEQELKKIAKLRGENLNDLMANAYLAEVLSIEQSANPDVLIELVGKALQFNPGNAMANQMMGNAYLRASQPKKAARFYRKSIVIKSGDAVAHRGLALANGQLGLLDQSIAEANVALSLVPDDTESLNILGLGLIGKGRIRDAMAYLEKSLKINPENISTKEYLSLARERVK